MLEEVIGGIRNLFIGMDLGRVLFYYGVRFSLTLNPNLNLKPKPGTNSLPVGGKYGNHHGWGDSVVFRD